MIVTGALEKKKTARLFDQYRKALAAACRQQGWGLAVARNHAQAIDQAKAGVRLAGCLTFGLDGPLQAQVDPSTVINWGSQWCDPAWSMLSVDRENASRLAFEYLWDLGHQRTAMVRLTPRGMLATEERGLVVGMRKAYASMGLDWHPREVVTISSPDGREIAGNAAEGLYERLLAQGVTGVYCISWRVLMALYRQAHERGHAIGKYLTIVGSGGHDLDDLVQPQPPRVYWHFTDYADAVIRSLRLLQEGTPLPRRIRIPVYLRESFQSISPILQENRHEDD